MHDIDSNSSELPASSIRQGADPVELRYAGFWQRFAAYWIDFAVYLPVVGITYLLGEQTRLFNLYFLVPGLIIGVFFHVYLVKRFGGTPGKLILGIRISMVDGAPVTLRAASLRYAPLFVLTALMTVALAMATLRITDDEYFSLAFVARSQRIVELAPTWYFTVNLLLQVWIWSEFLTMLFNKRRRAIHDYLAGTVVLRR